MYSMPCHLKVLNNGILKATLGIDEMASKCNDLLPNKGLKVRKDICKFDSLHIQLLLNTLYYHLHCTECTMFCCSKHPAVD